MYIIVQYIFMVVKQLSPEQVQYVKSYADALENVVM